MAGILVYSDKEHYAFELIKAAQIIASDLSLPIHAVVINDRQQAYGLSKRAATHQIENAAINLADPAAVTSALKQAANQLSASIVLLSSNRRGKELAGRLAQSLQAGCLTDVNNLKANQGKIECSRNALGGATVAIQQVESENQVIAIMPRAFEQAPEATGSLAELGVDVKPRLKVLETRSRSGDNVDIEAADVLMVVGQGMESREDLVKVQAIAKALGGEIACTKPVATDKKWLSEERIVGLSGKKCKPGLAILLGISGQVQFTVGIRDAKTIVAINNDENAAIMQMADYVLKADLADVLPRLLESFA